MLQEEGNAMYLLEDMWDSDIKMTIDCLLFSYPGGSFLLTP
jgi:hypothetical protein